MLADLDDTLRDLLIRELPVRNNEIDIKFDQPTREWSARLTKPTINLFLYDVRENNTLRQHQWVPTGNGTPSTSSRRRTPFRVDCTYMVTTWAAEAEDEHRLLSAALMALFRHPILEEHLLTEPLKDQPYEIQARVAVHDRLTNPAEVWGSLDNEIRPSVPYIITLALDPWAEVTGPLVRAFTLRTGQAQGLPWEPGLQTIAAEMTTLGGAILTKSGAPVAGITVAVRDTGLLAETDAEGRYSLGPLPPGDYTIVAWPAQGKARTQAITVPLGPEVKASDIDFVF